MRSWKGRKLKSRMIDLLPSFKRIAGLSLNVLRVSYGVEKKAKTALPLSYGVEKAYLRLQVVQGVLFYPKFNNLLFYKEIILKLPPSPPYRGRERHSRDRGRIYTVQGVSQKEAGASDSEPLLNEIKLLSSIMATSNNKGRFAPHFCILPKSNYSDFLASFFFFSSIASLFKSFSFLISEIRASNSRSAQYI